ncbi:MAG: hypothetical protein ACRDKT_12610, partial [Actinomycetota bacterium]
VVAGGRGIKARRYALAGAASIVVIALLAWGSTGGRVLDRGNGEVADPGPTATEENRVVAACGQVPFRPGYLPDGWDYVLEEGSGGQRGIPLDEQSPQALGHWAGGAADSGTFIDVYEYDSAPYPNVKNPEAIRVLDVDAVIGDIHEGFGATFTYEGCRWVLNAFGPPRNELRKVAENLEPRDECAGYFPPDAASLPDGRHFGVVEAAGATGLAFNEQRLLTGDEATQAAREDGMIGPGETVPNDYYIDDDNAAVRGMSVLRDVEVFLETSPRDGMVNLAEWDYADFVCMFESGDPVDRANVQFPFWITVERGIVTKLEQQFLP